MNDEYLRRIAEALEEIAYRMSKSEGKSVAEEITESPAWVFYSAVVVSVLILLAIIFL